MKANDGRYITVAKEKGHGVVTLRFEEANAIEFASKYRAYVVLNGATGALVKIIGSPTDEMWDRVAEIRRSLHNR